MISNISIKDDILKDEKYKYLFSVEAVNELVNRGIPFREAYKQIESRLKKANLILIFLKDYNIHTKEVLGI